jgi:DNA-binding response OmpR family regulator
MAPQARRTQPLVVDDEVSIAAVLFTTFRFLGFDVATASTGRQALSHIAHHTPDAVLLDLALPDGDGLVLYDELRSAGLTAPVLFLTARHNAEDKVRGPTLGADDYGNIETYIHYLRHKLQDSEQKLIRTIRSLGYLVPARGQDEPDVGALG